MTNLMYYINENFVEPGEGLENSLPKDEYCAYAAAFAGIATFAVLNVLLYRSEKRKKILKRQAEERGTFITAHLISSYKHRDSDAHEYEYCGEYRYEVNGKVKKYRTYSVCHLPESIRMYPMNSAGTKFFSDHDGKKVNAAIGFNGLAGIAAGFAVYAAAIHFVYRGLI